MDFSLILENETAAREILGECVRKNESRSLVSSDSTELQ